MGMTGAVGPTWKAAADECGLTGECGSSGEVAAQATLEWAVGCSAVLCRGQDALWAVASPETAVGAQLDLINALLIIDLADIYYEADINVNSLLSESIDDSGIALVFESRNPMCSYLSLPRQHLRGS